MSDDHMTAEAKAYNIRINSLMGRLWDVYTCSDPDAATKNNRVWDLLVAFDAEVRREASDKNVTKVSTTQAAEEAETRIRADEREKCAEVAESAPYKRESMVCGCSEGLADFTAAAIRARSQEGET